MTDIEVGRYALRTFRIRSVDGVDQLGSLFQKTTWANGVAIAHCLKNDEAPCAESPGEKCTCGLYGHLNLDLLLGDYRKDALTNVAVFAAEGTTFIGPRGLRTAAARIVAYWCCSEVASLPPGALWHESRSGLFFSAIYAKQCPDAKCFEDPNEMLAAYGFPACRQEFPPQPPRPALSLPEVRKRLGLYEHFAPLLSMATPKGIEVVRALLEGTLSG